MTLTSGSLKVLMDRLTEAEKRINPALPAGMSELHLYRWRPSGIDPPALYHMVAGAPFSALDTAAYRDDLSLLCRIAVAHTMDSEEMERLEVYTDTFREVMDPLLVSRGRPLQGAATWAERSDMRSVLDDFSEVPYLCMEFVLRFKLDRIIPDVQS